MDMIEAKDYENYCLRAECDRLAENLAHAVEMKEAYKGKLMVLLDVSEARIQEQAAMSEKIVSLLSHTWDNVELQKILSQHGLDQILLGKIALSAVKRSERSTSIESEMESGWSDPLDSSQFSSEPPSKEVDPSLQMVPPCNKIPLTPSSTYNKKIEAPEEASPFKASKEILETAFSSPKMETHTHVFNPCAHTQDISTLCENFEPSLDVAALEGVSLISGSLSIESDSPILSLNETYPLYTDIHLYDPPSEKNSSIDIEAEAIVSSLGEAAISEAESVEKEICIPSHSQTDLHVSDVFSTQDASLCLLESPVETHTKYQSSPQPREKRWMSLRYERRNAFACPRPSTKEKQNSYPGNNRRICTSMPLKEALLLSQSNKKVTMNKKIETESHVENAVSQISQAEEKDVLARELSITEGLNQTRTESLYESSRRLRIEEEAKRPTTRPLKKKLKQRVGYYCTPSSSLHPPLKTKRPASAKFPLPTLPSFHITHPSSRQTIASGISKPQNQFPGVFSGIPVFGLDVLGERNDLKPMEPIDDILGLIKQPKTVLQALEGSLSSNDRATINSVYYPYKSYPLQDLPSFPHPPSRRHARKDATKLFMSTATGHYPWLRDSKRSPFAFPSLYLPSLTPSLPYPTAYRIQNHHVSCLYPRRNNSIVDSSFQYPVRSCRLQKRSTYLPLPVQPISVLSTSQTFSKEHPRRYEKNRVSVANSVIFPPYMAHPSYLRETVKTSLPLYFKASTSLDSQESLERNSFINSQMKAAKYRNSFLLSPQNLPGFLNSDENAKMLLSSRRSLQ